MGQGAEGTCRFDGFGCFRGGGTRRAARWVVSAGQGVGVGVAWNQLMIVPTSSNPVGIARECQDILWSRALSTSTTLILDPRCLSDISVIHRLNLEIQPAANTRKVKLLVQFSLPLLVLNGKVRFRGHSISNKPSKFSENVFICQTLVGFSF